MFGKRTKPRAAGRLSNNGCFGRLWFCHLDILSERNIFLIEANLGQLESETIGSFDCAVFNWVGIGIQYERIAELIEMYGQDATVSETFVTGLSKFLTEEHVVRHIEPDVL